MTLNLTGDLIELPGYPSKAGNYTGLYNMWTDTGFVSRQDANAMLFYDADSSKGNSGSPVFWNSSAYACAIHAYGDDNYIANSGARIKGSLYDVIMQYR